MRLKYEKNKMNNNKIIAKKKTNHLKSSSTNNIFSSSYQKNIYLNKILNKNIGNTKLSNENIHYNDNIPNFQSKIQNINSNDEKYQKTKNYIINLRNRNISESSYQNSVDYSQKKNLLSTYCSGFYNSIKKKTYEILDNSPLKNYCNWNINERSVNNKKWLFNNSQEIDNNNIKIERIYNNKINSLGNSNIYEKNKTSKDNDQKIKDNENINIKHINDINDRYDKNYQLLKSSRTKYNISNNRKNIY
jgi:hypothetical protein